jgi:hypothetical protein
MSMTDFVAWDEFRTELVNHVGVKRAHVIFCEQTGYSSSTFYHWKRMDQVPREALEKIADIEIGECDKERFKGFHSQKFFRRVVELSNKNTPIKEIARTLTEELGRKITEGAVKSARFRMKEKIPGYKTRGAGPDDVAEYEQRIARGEESTQKE